MIRKRKKPEPIQRTPHINRQKQSAFQYSSNRSYTERTSRENPDKEEPSFALPKLRLAAFKVVHGVAVLGFFGIIILLSLLFTKPHLKIVNSQSLRSQSAYDSSLAELTGSGFMSHSKLTINRTDLAAQIEEKFPELQNINVSTPLFSPSIVVTAQASQPTMLLVANSKSYVLDNRGIALATADQTKTPSTKLLKMEDQTGADITVGKPALTSPQVAFIAELKRQSDAKQLTIDQMFLVAGGGELDVRYIGSSYVVKYNLYEDARKSFGTFFATKEFLDNTKAPPAEYIDVRVAERAYTK